MNTPRLVPLDDPEFRQIEDELQSFPRQDGYYLTRFASVIELRQQGRSQEAILEALCEAWAEHEATLADARMRGYTLEPPPDARWEDQEMPLTDSLEALTFELQGGSAIGHTEETMPPEKATELTSRFAALFESPRAYRGLGWGDPQYVFEQGVLLVDEARAGLLLIIESD